MAMLSKDELWQFATDLPSEEVPIRDANGKVRGTLRIRGLSGAELTDYQESLSVPTKNGRTKVNMKRAMAKLVLLCACNDDGSRYFEDSELIKIDQMPAATLMPLFESAQKLCGLSDDDMRQMTEDFPQTES